MAHNLLISAADLSGRATFASEHLPDGAGVTAPGGGEAKLATKVSEALAAGVADQWPEAGDPTIRGLALAVT